MAAAGVASRRKCEELISERRVSVNGTVITEPGVKVDADIDKIVVNGRQLTKTHRRYYVAVNKPRGYVSAVSDPHGMKTVTSLVDLQSRPLLRPVGRLDMDSDGLIFLTDDGDFQNKLSHPRHEVGKTYRAIVSGIVGEDALQSLTTGIVLVDGLTRPATNVRLNRTIRGEDGTPQSIVDLTIFEGRNRQVRRMFEALGHQVQRLTRVAIGPVRLSGIPSGGWRHLTPSEVQTLMGLAVTKSTVNEEPACQTEKSHLRPTKALSSPSFSKPRPRSPRRTS